VAAILCTGYVSAQAQLPPMQWALHYGGGNVDIPYVINLPAMAELLLPVIPIQKPVM